MKGTLMAKPSAQSVCFTYIQKWCLGRFADSGIPKADWLGGWLAGGLRIKVMDHPFDLSARAPPQDLRTLGMCGGPLVAQYAWLMG